MGSWSAVSRKYLGVSAVVSVAVLGACVSNDASSVAGPDVRPGSGTFANSGEVNVCIAAGSPAGAYSFSTAGSSVNASGAASQTLVANGVINVPANSVTPTCFTVFDRLNPANPNFDSEAQIAVSITAPGGAVYTSTSCVLDPDTPAPADCAGTAVSVFANFFHGTRVTFAFEAPAIVGCTLTQGYWKNHEETAEPLFASGGPIIIDFGANGVAGGTGANADRVVTFATYQAFMRQSSRDYQYALGQQLIAAELNIRNGATASPAVLAAMNEARVLLYQGVSDAEKARASELNDILTEFNEGDAAGSSPHCDD